MTRTILEQANDLIHGDRAKQYGPFAENAHRYRDLVNAYLRAYDDKGVPLDHNRQVETEDVPVLLDLLKTMRLASDPTHYDSWLDKAGYVGCAGKLDSIKDPEAEATPDDEPKPHPLARRYRRLTHRSSTGEGVGDLGWAVPRDDGRVGHRRVVGRVVQHEWGLDPEFRGRTWEWVD